MGITKDVPEKLKNVTELLCHLDMTLSPYKMVVNALVLQTQVVHSTNMENLPNAMEVRVGLWQTMCIEFIMVSRKNIS